MVMNDPLILKEPAMPIRTVTLPTGQTVPQLGLGTWMMGESENKRVSVKPLIAAE